MIPITIFFAAMASCAVTTIANQAVTYCGTPRYESDCSQGYKGEHCPYNKKLESEAYFYPADCMLIEKEKVTIGWTVGRDGEIKAVEILDSTNECVNDAAINNIRAQRYCAIHPSDTFSIERKFQTPVYFLPEVDADR